MATEAQSFDQWLLAAKVRPERLSDQQRFVLQATCRVLQDSNGGYSSARIASHFLLHCGLGLEVTQIARLVGINPRTAFRHRNLSAKHVGQQIHYHFHGRPYGKLLPRHAGSIADFLFRHPQATRDELLGFIARAWKFRVSKVALWEFLKKYGLDRDSLKEARQDNAAEEQQRLTAQVLEARAPGALVPVPPDRFFFAHTQYAGAFLLWPQVLSWLDAARDCFSDDYGSLERGFLTSAFGLIVGLPRVFHLDQMQDLGFAVLTGDARRCPSRYDVGAWRRHLLWNEVDRFCHRTSPWDLLRQQDLLMSFDEHAIPRWTKKFVIPKGYVTTRNKYMRCEKLYLGYEVNLRRFATIKAPAPHFDWPE